MDTEVQPSECRDTSDIFDADLSLQSPPEKRRRKRRYVSKTTTLTDRKIRHRRHRVKSAALLDRPKAVQKVRQGR